MTAVRSGRVTAFDEEAGWGWVRADDGGEHFFHCTAVADGTRRVAVGDRVAFSVQAGHHGAWEAAGLLVTPHI